MYSMLHEAPCRLRTYSVRTLERTLWEVGAVSRSVFFRFHVLINSVFLPFSFSIGKPKIRFVCIIFIINLFFSIC